MLIYSIGPIINGCRMAVQHGIESSLMLRASSSNPQGLLTVRYNGCALDAMRTRRSIREFLQNEPSKPHPSAQTAKMTQEGLRKESCYSLWFCVDVIVHHEIKRSKWTPAFRRIYQFNCNAVEVPTLTLSIRLKARSNPAFSGLGSLG
jgi:hypothetical protein